MAPAHGRPCPDPRPGPVPPPDHMAPRECEGPPTAPTHVSLSGDAQGRRGGGAWGSQGRGPGRLRACHPHSHPARSPGRGSGPRNPVSPPHPALQRADAQPAVSEWLWLTGSELGPAGSLCGLQAAHCGRPGLHAPSPPISSPGSRLCCLPGWHYSWSPRPPGWVPREELGAAVPPHAWAPAHAPAQGHSRTQALPHARAHSEDVCTHARAHGRRPRRHTQPRPERGRPPGDPSVTTRPRPEPPPPPPSPPQQLGPAFAILAFISQSFLSAEAFKTLQLGDGAAQEHSVSAPTRPSRRVRSRPSPSPAPAAAPAA